MTNYDYIVVGAGSAGAVIASRLSENPAVRMLLIEAGGSGRHMNVRIPAAFAKQFKSPLDWEYFTEPEPHLNGRKIYHPRGKMLGGSSGMNAMIYIRGNRYDYDSWSAAGAQGWSYDEVLPYFTRAENNSRGADRYHGNAGPLYIEDPRSPNPISERLVDAMVSAGLTASRDFNGAQQEGAGLYQLTQHRGARWTTNDGYLRPARKRPNLTVLTKTHVLRIVVHDDVAVGVEATTPTGRQLYSAEREVVLSAGAFGSPHLLMLSGIGPADHLREHGIDVLVDNPHVGAHLTDHPMYLLNYETTARGTLAQAEKPAQLVKYLAARRGLLTSNVGEAGAFFPTRDGLPAPDMQLIAGPAYFRDNGFATHDSAAVALGCSLVAPSSTGTVRLRSADPLQKPSLRFDYFSDPADMTAMIAAIHRTREIARSRPLSDIVGKEIHPSTGKQSDEELADEIRNGVDHTYHPACTARIGSDTDGVVDPSLRVYGVSRLRIADASVFPSIPRGNIHAPTVMVGEKAAELIKGQS